MYARCSPVKCGDIKMFCPKCGSILIPKKEKEKKKLVCSCGYSSDETGKLRIEEKMRKEKAVDIVDDDTELESLPQTDAECPKCKNKKAYYWLVQTRAGDEPETKFLKCTKCRHTWRDYS